MKLLWTLMTVLCFLTSVNAKEKREYEKINDDTMIVRVYQDGILQQVGTLKYHHDKWQACGIWKQLDKDGAINMRAEYECGRRVWVEKDLGQKIVRIDRKGAI